jgi:hypothetical protein
MGKMITHEEILKLSKQCYSDVKTNMTQQQVWDTEKKIVKIQTYIHEQEKVSELLGLYQKREISRNTINGFETSWELTNKIKALESELNE